MLTNLPLIHPTYQLHTALHQSLLNIVDIMKEYEANLISFQECYDKFYRAITLISEFNATACRLNMQFWEVNINIPQQTFTPIDLSQRTFDGKNILNHTVSHAGITRFLLELGIRSSSAITDAIEDSQICSLSYLLDYFIEDFSQDLDFGAKISKIVDITARKGSHPALRLILSRFKPYIHKVNDQCLLNAITQNDEHKLDLLLEAGVNAYQNHTSNLTPWDNFSPLEIATLLKKPLFMKKIIETGISVNNKVYPSILPNILCGLSKFIHRPSSITTKYSALMLIKYGLDLYQKYNDKTRDTKYC